MRDEELRALEREAAQGDPDARRAYKRMRKRTKGGKGKAPLPQRQQQRAVETPDGDPAPLARTGNLFFDYLNVMFMGMPPFVPWSFGLACGIAIGVNAMNLLALIR